jgi:hypothetical protein
MLHRCVAGGLAVAQDTGVLDAFLGHVVGDHLWRGASLSRPSGLFVSLTTPVA